MSDPLSVLNNLTSVEQRIDAVAKDLRSGEKKFAEIDVCELGDALDIGWENMATDGWYRYFLASRPDQDSMDYPYGEAWQQVSEKLRDKFSPSRFKKLDKQASAIEEGDCEEDLSTSEDEKSIIWSAYIEHKEVASEHDYLCCEKKIVASDGTILLFQAWVGDGGELDEIAGPYDFPEGDSGDFSDYIITDEGF